MTLPEPALQMFYARAAWAVVLAAVAASLAARRGNLPRPALVALALACALAQALPGTWSPSHWLGLAFQAPAAFTTALAALVLGRHWLGRPRTGLLPLPLAAVLAVAGAWLYLDASGWVAHGAYHLGFTPFTAPLFALLLAASCLLCITRGTAVGIAGALFAATVLFMLLRLPTGNLWDALLDPFLWAWAVLVCAKAARAPVRARPGTRPSPESP